MKTTYTWLISLIFFSTLLIACGPTPISETVGTDDAAEASASLVQVNACNSSLSGSQVVAEYALQKGVFEKHGLDVNLIDIDGGSKAVSAMIAGDVDFCQVAGSAVVNAAVAGEDLVFIGGLYNTYIYSLMVLPEIETAEDLKGKALAVSNPGASSDTALRAALAGLGLEADEDVAILAVGGQSERLAAMETGQVAGTVVSIPQTVKAKELGYRVLLDMSELGTPYQHTAIATKRSYIEANPEITANFMKAIVEAVAMMKQDREGTMAVTAQYLLLDEEADAPSLNESYDVLIQGYLQKVPLPSVPGIETLLAEAEAENPAAADFKAEDMIDASFVEELESSGFISALYPE